MICLTSFFVVRYYSLKFRPLIIRNNISDMNVFRDVFLFKCYDLPVKLNPKLIIDCGANIGYASLYFALKYPSAKIVSVEPEQDNYKLLKKHTIRLPNIKTIKAGIWHKKAFLKIIDRGLACGFTVKEVKKTCEDCVKAITIQDILKKTKSERIDILKIDVEGAEKELFTNNYESWLNKTNVLIIELHDRIKEGCSDAFYSAINKKHWKKFVKGENIILIRKGQKIK